MSEKNLDRSLFKPGHMALGDGVTDTLTFKFANAKAAEHFKAWLCCGGEQHYWDSMWPREEEEDGDITALRFDYGSGSTVNVETGRMDRDRNA